MAEVYRLEMWMNPHGFLKAARLPGANPVALWRWEQIEKGRDGNVVSPEKMHVVAITMLGKYRVDATINPQNQMGAALLHRELSRSFIRVYTNGHPIVGAL